MPWKKILVFSFLVLFSTSCQKHENIRLQNSRFSEWKSPIFEIDSETENNELLEDLETLELEEENFIPIENIDISTLKKLYQEMKLENSLPYEVFEQAVKGMNHIMKRKRNLLTIVDFSRSANEERLFILDLEGKKVLLKSLVSHGKGSGEIYATRFSNRSGSNQSSNGFFLTGNPYRGKNGFSLRLYGLEKGRNHLAYERTLVVHAADYVCQKYIKSNGRLGRSKGCFAVPETLNREIINLISNRTVFYVHSKGLHYKDFSF